MQSSCLALSVGEGLGSCSILLSALFQLPCKQCQALSSHLCTLLAIRHDSGKHGLISITCCAMAKEVDEVVHEELHPAVSRLMLSNHLIVLCLQHLLLHILLVCMEPELLLLIFQGFDPCLQLLFVALYTLHVTIQFGNELFLLRLVNRDLLFHLASGKPQSFDSCLQTFVLTAKPREVCCHDMCRIILIVYALVDAFISRIVLTLIGGS